MRFASMSAEDCWQELLKVAADCEEDDYIDSPDFLQADALVEALARNPDFAAPAAMEVLNEPPTHWAEAWCCNLLGKMRHAPQSIC